MKIGIINVGANTRQGSLKSPKFKDGTFEFVPIPEEKCPDYKKIPRYKDLNFRYKNYSDFIPEKMYDVRAHNDPEFETNTYGDLVDSKKSKKASRLREMTEGDVLLFLANLFSWEKKSFSKQGQFYIVGYLKIDSKPINLKITSKKDMMAMNNNIHVKRVLKDKRNYIGDWVFVGTKDSGLFKKAVPFPFELATKIVFDKEGNKIKHSKKQSDLSTLASYTRAFRPIEGPRLEKRIDIFINHINKYEKISI